MSHAGFEGVEKGRLGPRSTWKESLPGVDSLSDDRKNRGPFWPELLRETRCFHLRWERLHVRQIGVNKQELAWALNLKCRLAVRVMRWDEVDGWCRQVWSYWRREAVLGQRCRFGILGVHLMTDNWDWVRSTSPWETQVWTRQRAEPLLQEGVSVSRTLWVSREETRRKEDNIVTVFRSHKRRW